MIGRIVRDFAPEKDNPRNSEGAFLTLKDGCVLFAYTRYSGNDWDDGAPADIYACVSGPDGEDFSRPFPLLLRSDAGAENIMSVSLMRMENGDAGMLFLAKSKPYRCIPYFTRSGDEGKTWQKPAPCIAEPGYYVVNNDRVIKSGKGTFMFAAAHTPVKAGADADGITFKKGAATNPEHIWVFRSDDDGNVWKKTAVIAYDYAPKSCFHAGWQEPGLIETDDGRIKMMIRTEFGRIYESYSSDGGVQWTAPVPSEFTAPVSPISMKRLSHGKSLYVWNPVPLWNGKSQHVRNVWTGARTPLVAAVLRQDRPLAFKEIENDESRGYAYTAIHELADGSVLLAYCAGGVSDGGMLNRLRIKKLSAEEINAL